MWGDRWRRRLGKGKEWRGRREEDRRGKDMLGKGRVGVVGGMGIRAAVSGTS